MVLCGVANVVLSAVKKRKSLYDKANVCVMTNLSYKISLSEAGYMLWTGIFSEKQKFIRSEKSQDDMFFFAWFQCKDAVFVSENIIILMEDSRTVPWFQTEK